MFVLELLERRESTSPREFNWRLERMVGGCVAVCCSVVGCFDTGTSGRDKRASRSFADIDIGRDICV